MGIFFELEYWGCLSLQRNLDVKHIEKNINENLVDNLLNIMGKTKDTENAHMDLQDIKIRKDLHLRSTFRGKVKPPACYVLTSTERKSFCEWLKTVKFSDVYASNIGRCVKDGTLTGLKSHDYHVLLEILLLMNIHPFLPP